MIKAFAFDLDGTLTQHRTKIEEKNRRILEKLSEKYKLLMVGAGACLRIHEQLLGFPIDIIGNYGMQYAKFENGELKIIRNDTLPVRDRELVEETVLEFRKKYGFMNFSGNGVEYHASGCITFPILGTKAKIEEKLAFDPNRKKRRKFYGEVCEAFPCGDLLYGPSGEVFPQIGFFTEPYHYPAVRENGREWMTLNPNEIITMRAPLARARGRVLTYGLGLGYFAFMASRKESVSSVTVVERDPSVIRLFEEEIRPQLPTREKITVVCKDAFEFAKEDMKAGGYDFVFADIWHDPSDGVEAYLRFKLMESYSPKSEFAYWIEPTLRYYL